MLNTSRDKQRTWLIQVEIKKNGDQLRTWLIQEEINKEHC